MNAVFSVITPESGDWVCECADETCVGLVRMSISEYETIRAQPNRFFVLPDGAHVTPAIERVVERTDHYWVVEKVGIAGLLAEQSDPRSRS